MKEFINRTHPVFSASAPGRLDVMGGIADYSGSLLLQMPVRERTTVTLQPREEPLLWIRTVDSLSGYAEFRMDMALLDRYAFSGLGQQVRSMPQGDWAVYIVGCLSLFRQTHEFPWKGLSVLVESSIPQGKGVSSSASLEIAFLQALTKGIPQSFSALAIPLLGQRAENQVVGAPCGLMDQLSTYFGRAHQLLPLVCQPHEVLSPIPLPSSLQFFAIDSGIRHAVSGASYSEVRTAAFMAYSWIAVQEGLAIAELKSAAEQQLISGLPYRGYLANIPLSHFQTHLEAGLPEQLKGEEFLNRGLLSIDPVTRVDPQATYRLRACAKHPVGENDRIHRFREVLQQWRDDSAMEEQLHQLGVWMYESHAGYSSVGLGNAQTDDLVERARQKGARSGVYGARVSGGGSGGTVVILCSGAKGEQTVREIHREYQQAVGQAVHLFSGSSEGALYS